LPVNGKQSAINWQPTGIELFLVEEVVSFWLTSKRKILSWWWSMFAQISCMSRLSRHMN